MGKGRKQKPTVLKLLTGNPGKRALPKNEPQFEPSAGDVPPELKRKEHKLAKKEWARVAPLLVAAGVMTEIDQTALMAYCLAYQRWIEAEDSIREHGVFVKTKAGWVTMNPYVRVAALSLEQMRSFMGDFGMTPSSRVKIPALLPPTKEDPLEGLLSRAKDRSA